MEHHACEYCQLGPFCDCGRLGEDSTTYLKSSQQLRLFKDTAEAQIRLNNAIKHAKEGTQWKEDITSWTEWIATGRTLLRATLRKTKSRLSLSNLIGR